MPNIRNEINIVSGFLDATPDDFVNQLKFLGVEIVGCRDYKESEAKIKTVEFKGPRGVEFAAINGHLAASTSPEIMRQLGTKLNIKPGVFNWSMKECPRVCEWLITPPVGISIRGCMLRAKGSKSVFVFDRDTEENQPAIPRTVQALYEASKGYNVAYLLASVAFCPRGESIYEIIVDFDGYVTASILKSKKNEMWVEEAIREYVSILSYVNARMETAPETRSDLPEWMIDIFGGRRWDKEDGY